MDFDVELILRQNSIEVYHLIIYAEHVMSKLKK